MHVHLIILCVYVCECVCTGEGNNEPYQRSAKKKSSDIPLSSQLVLPFFAFFCQSALFACVQDSGCLFRVTQGDLFGAEHTKVTPEDLPLQDRQPDSGRPNTTHFLHLGNTLCDDHT